MLQLWDPKIIFYVWGIVIRTARCASSRRPCFVRHGLGLYALERTGCTLCMGGGRSPYILCMEGRDSLLHICMERASYICMERSPYILCMACGSVHMMYGWCGLPELYTEIVVSRRLQAEKLSNLHGFQELCIEIVVSRRLEAENRR